VNFGHPALTFKHLRVPDAADLCDEHLDNASG
jgi:hypothetical protein